MKNWFFDHNSASFDHFCVLCFDCILKKVFSDSRWLLMSNMAVELKKIVQFFGEMVLKNSRWRPIQNFSSNIDSTENLIEKTIVFVVLFKFV
jgi:hypothetical protein